MTEATLLALGSAFLHAGWNLLIKTSDERFLAAWGQFLLGGVLFLPVLLLVGLPGTDVVPLLVASSCVHVVYIGALVRAYHHGDFSFAYPLARGGGALLAAIGGVLFLSDLLSAGEWVAIGVVVVGLVSLVRPGVSTVALAWAALTALTIGTYTTIDIEGAAPVDGLRLRDRAHARRRDRGVDRRRRARSWRCVRPLVPPRRGAATHSAVPRRRSPTRWSSPPAASRRPGTSLPCGSRRSCSARSAAGSCSTSASVEPG
jgi:multidrug transporter EmrE-like cation transporter